MAGDQNGGKVTVWEKNRTWVRNIPACSTIAGGIAFSPDNQTIATGCSDNLVKLWSLNGKLLRVFKGHQAIVWDVAFNQDGTRLVSASGDGTAKLWRSDGHLLATFAQHKAPISSVAYTSQARYTNGSDSIASGGILIASASTDRSVKLWQPNGTLVATFNGHTAAVNKVEFSADGRNVISASTDHTAIIWKLNTIIHSEDVLKFGCEWIKGYLQNNSDLSENDRTLCNPVINRSIYAP